MQGLQCWYRPMNGIGENDEAVAAAVCGASDMILCAHPHCNEVLERFRAKKYHSKDCKDNHSALMRELGKQVLNRGKIKAAKLENSPRLQRVAKYLSDGKPHTTRDIQIACDVCCVGTIVSELRDEQNGFDITCTQVAKGRFEYTMIGGETQLLRLV